jgi:purine-binding chemotaxis protein CheW
MVPDYVRGVINLRGNVVPVIDLPMRFGWPSSEVGKRTCIVIIEVDEGGDKLEIGIVIDSVNEVLDIDAKDIGAPPSFGAKLRTDFISGMGRVRDEFIILLNVGKVLSVEELSMLEHIPASSEASSG